LPFSQPTNALQKDRTLKVFALVIQLPQKEIPAIPSANILIQFKTIHALPKFAQKKVFAVLALMDIFKTI